MSKNTCRATAIALVTATALSGPPANADVEFATNEPPCCDAPGEVADLPPALDAFLDIIADLPEQLDREPAWRNPHASPRPSPDRDFVF